MKALAPQYKFEKIDQNLYVTGNWEKDKEAYYDDTYLDTRIVKLIPVVNGKIVENMTSLPGNVTKINLFSHGWTKEIKIANQTDRTQTDLKNWLKGYENVELTQNYEDSIDMAKISSLNDTESITGNSLNIALVWRDASIDLRTADLSGSSYSLGLINIEKLKKTPKQPVEAAKWIEAVAQTVSNHLSILAKDSSTKIAMNCTGHSLGSFLCNEIGKMNINIKASTKVENSKIIALDPAAEKAYMYYIGGTGDKYNLNGNSEINLDYDKFFKLYYPESIGFYAVDSACGNEKLAKTANIFVKIKFNENDSMPGGGEVGDLIGECKRHTATPGLYKSIVANQNKIQFPDLNTADKRIDQLNASDFTTLNQSMENLEIITTPENSKVRFIRRSSTKYNFWNFSRYETTHYIYLPNETNTNNIYDLNIFRNFIGGQITVDKFTFINRQPVAEEFKYTNDNF
jgi:hypothetical protein